ncbi:MAG: class I SAM-dependent methyltransferase [Proteobacteria bacterium]|nr:class I SAM-dependent methyltransferase [Pseudomonadota bacterium]
MMVHFLERQWKKITSREEDSHQTFWTWRLTPIGYAMHKALFLLIAKYMRGKLLDVGAGTMLYKKDLTKHCISYVSVDKFSNHKSLDYRYDINDLKFDDASFDSIFCNQVLEHLEDPQKALQELDRILHAKGKLLIGVPFFYYLHGLPHDYYRFTEFGLKKMLGDSGFKIITLQSSGGFFSTFIEPFNIAFTFLGFNIPLWKQFINSLNFILFVFPFYLLDLLLHTKSRFPSVYFLVAQKEETI